VLSADAFGAFEEAGLENEDQVQVLTVTFVRLSSCWQFVLSLLQPLAGCKAPALISRHAANIAMDGSALLGSAVYVFILAAQSTWPEVPAGDNTISALFLFVV
jgi:hypothetical protein